MNHKMCPLSSRLVCLQAQFTVRTKTDQVEMIVIHLPIDEYQIRLDMAIVMIRPFTGKRMIEVATGKWFVGGKKIHNPHQVGIERFAVPA